MQGALPQQMHDTNFSWQVPPEVKAMLKAVHQFGLVGGEDYDSKVA